MVRKKQGGKKTKTYRSKFGKKKEKKVKDVKEVKSTKSEDVNIIPRPASEMQKMKISKEKLPESYTPVDNQAYTFPPFGYVMIIAGILGLMAYLLF
ncbi:MAG: hypothetical protein VX777_02960 [Chlamydiota bacterium]|nr:hypothetical protein [Chlamydiota bacterium]